MEVESQTKTRNNTLYNKNDFLIIHDSSAADFFSLALVTETVEAKDPKVKAIFMERYKDHRKDFHPVKEGILKMEDVLEKTEDVIVAKASKKKGVQKTDIKVYFTASDYNRTKDRVKEILRKRGLLEIEEEEQEEDQEVVDRQLISQMMELEIVKVKRRSTQAMPKIKKKKKLVMPKFKKGTTNPWVGVVDYCRQFDDTNPNPTFTIDQINNNKELVRAVNIKSMPLVEAIIANSNEISTFSQPLGPNSNITPYILSLKTKQYDLFFYLIEAAMNRNIKLGAKKRTGFKYIDTGFNDKYAYGVQTRAVTMSRGNREGTNALMADENVDLGKNLENFEINYILQKVDDISIVEKLIALENNLRSDLIHNLIESFLSGNNVLAGYLLRIAYESNGYGLNKYFELGCIAESPEQLQDMKKASSKKKSYLKNNITALHCACINPNGSILEKYLEIGEEMYLADEMLRKPVHYAACCSSTEPLKILLNKGIDCRDYDKNKMTPLMYAANSGRVNNIILMCEHVAYNLNVKSKEGYAAIHYASMHDHLDCVKELVNRGSDINLTGKQRMTPLMLASARGHFEMVEYLVENGAKILRTDAFKRSALIHAVMNCQLKIASYLLMKGADFNSCDSSKNFPLHYACAYGSEELVDLLIQAGADINAVNNWNMTPILIALLKNHYGCLSKLTTYAGIDVDCQDNNGSTLLASCFVKFEKASYDFAKFLIEQKEASPNICDFEGNNCLHLLASIDIESQLSDREFINYQHYKDTKAELKELYVLFFNLLIENGVEYSQPNANLYTPLMIGLQKCNKLFLDLILNMPFLQIRHMPDNKTTILHYCDKILSLRNGPEYIEKIIKKMESLESTSSQVNDEGFNHFQFLTYNFVHANFNKEIQTYNLRKEHLNKLLNQLMRISQNNIHENNINDDEIRLLQQKLNDIDEKIRIIPSFKNQNFIRIVDLFDKNKYDFSQKVQIIKTPYEPSKANLSSNMYFRINKYHPLYRFNSITNVNNDKIIEKKEFDLVINDHAEASGLHLLIECPQKDVLLYYINLLKKKKIYKPNETNYFGETVWHYFNGNHPDSVEAVKILYDIGENPNIADKKGNYPFLNLVHSATNEVIDMVLDIGIDCDVKNENGLSALIYYAQNRNLPQIQKLIDKNCDINITDNKGRNALHWAINNNTGNDTTFDLEEYLLQTGININTLDSKQRNPIHYFFTKINNTGINSKTDPIELFTDFLLYGNINLDHQDEYGRTPITYAAQRGAYLCTSVLINRGCNYNNMDIFDNNVFNTALINNHMDIAILLIQKEAKINFIVNIINFEAMETWNQLKVSNTKRMQIENEVIEIRKKDIKTNTTDHQSNYQPNDMSRRTQRKKVRTTLPDSDEFGKKYTEKQLQELADKNFIEKVMTPFKIALEKQSDPIKYLLIDQGFDVALAIMDTFEYGAVQYSVKLLTKKFNIDTAINNKKYHTLNQYGQNIFHIFAKNSNKFDKIMVEKIFNLIYEKGVDLQLEDETGTPPIIYAAASAQTSVDLIEYMVQNGADPNITDALGNTVLSTLFQNRAELKCKTFNIDLLKGNNYSSIGIDQTNKITKDSDMISHNAFKNTFAGTMANNITPYNNYYLPQNTSTHNQNFNAAKNKFIVWLEHFITTFGVEVNFDFEIRSNSLNQDESFIDKNTSGKYYSLLSYVVIKLRNAELLRLILNFGANINQQDIKGQTIVTYAIKNNILPLIAFLKDYEKKIDFSVVDKKGKTYIHHVVSPFKSASFQNTNLLEYLAKFVDINKTDNSGHAPIYYAQQQESGVMFNALLRLNANAFKAKDVIPEPVHVTASQIFPERVFDNEEDYNAYVQNIKENEPDVEIESKDELDSRIHGRVRMVYDINKKPYNVSLLKVEINYGFYSSNVYYKMQIAFEELRKVYILFTNWGRMGTSGQHQLTPFYNLEDCKAEFCKIFKEKTGNDYDNIDNFTHILKKYNLIRAVKRIYHKNIIERVQVEGRGLAKSKIPEDLQYLMKNLMDSNYYQTVFKNFQIDDKLMPLGSIPTDILLKAQDILISIRDILKDIDKNKKKLTSSEIFEKATQIASLTSRYYELIPTQNYRTENIPAFSQYSLKNEFNRILDLLYLEDSVKLMIATQQRKKTIHPFDYCLKSLNIKIINLDKLSEEYAIIKKYIKCGAPGYQKDVIRNILAIERKEDTVRYSKWEKDSNKRLLFRGIRTENLLSILQQGLRIGMSESEEITNSFGNGIYFSDVFSNSINFSSNYNNKFDKPVYVLLCEVACGKIKEFNNPTFQHPPFADYDSVKGLGRYHHDKNKKIYLNDGCMVPLGNLTTRTPPKDKSYYSFGIIYNQYVIYDLSQIKIRYIIELNPNDSIYQNQDNYW